MDTTKEKERTASTLTVPVVANANTVTLALRTTLYETTVGSEGKPMSKPTCVITTITRVIADDDETPTYDPRLDKSKSTKIRCIKCNRDMSQKKCRKRKMEG
jgi:hypothetical protein